LAKVSKAKEGRQITYKKAKTEDLYQIEAEK
jgi:hypothetical protein